MQCFTSTGSGITSVTSSYYTRLNKAFKIMMFFIVTNSLAHVEGEVDVLFFGEEQNEKVITCLTLLDGRIQTDLWRHQN